MFSGGLALGAGLMAQPAMAQETAGAAQEPVVMPRVEVTGSSIKRLAAEGALPVTVINAEAIRASGVTSVTDLVHKMSVSQGSTGESASVGGSTFGFAGISVHDLGETRTLVLLNGKRLAQFGGQTLTGFGAAVDLNSIPLSAIDRVEVLTDGASALYGSDAIAGVVNFITKHDRTDGDVAVGYSHPQDGATEKRVSVTKGWGNVDTDGYNVMLSYGHDERTKLVSGARSFANTGERTFTQNGKTYRVQQASASPIPANVLDDLGQLISPYLKQNGKCPAKTFRISSAYESEEGEPRLDDYCGYDFVQDLEIYPERQRDNFMASATTKIGGHELYADLLLSRSKQTSRIAPVPGSIPIAAGSALAQRYLVPLGITGDTVAYYRLFDMGKRTDDDTSDFVSLALGSRGTFKGWDYDSSYNYSESRVKGNISGYPGALAVKRLAASGLLDPFVGPGQQSPEAQQAIAAANYKAYWDGGVSKLHQLQIKGSREITPMQGGAMMLGIGANVNRELFSAKPSLFAQGLLADPVAGTMCDGTDNLPCDTRFGDAASSLPYSASRTSTGLFAELVMPVLKTLELGTSVRLDQYSDFGNAPTAKASFKWTAMPTLMFRGSIGTGFHAPTVPQVNARVQGYGVTTGNYSCTPELAAIAAAHNALCQPGERQYDVLAGGNKDLQPEKSRQATLGFRYEPSGMISLGADLWHVAIRNNFGQLTEDVVFADPARYANSWGTQLDVGTGKTYLAFLQNNQNLGKSYSTGVDWDISARYRSTIGTLTSHLMVTQMLREVSQLEKGGQYYSAIGDFNELGGVTFRNQGTWSNTLKSGEWSHTLSLNFKSGYLDQKTTVDVLDASGTVTGQEDVRQRVGYFSTWDWQTVWNHRAWSLTAGALNLFNHAPPFVPSASGGGRGQQFGYDDRYYDARGRTLYANVSYKF
jgi:iron complex outermembrane receptor protein